MGLSLTTGQPVLQELLARLPASLEMVFLALLLACAIALPLGVLAATRPGSWIDQLCRLVTTAGVSLPTFFTGLLLAYVFYFLLGWAPSPMGRLDPMFSPPPTVTGLYLIDAALAGDAGDVVGQPEAADPAGADDGHLRAGADRAHDARVDAVGAVGRLHPHRARQRAVARHGAGHLRAAQRAAAGGDDAGHGLRLHARHQRHRREGLRLARCGQLCDRRAHRQRLRAGAGFRAGDGRAVRVAEPAGRPAVRADRPACERRRHERARPGNTSATCSARTR